MGRERINLLAPIDDPVELHKALAAVGECVLLRKRGGTWSFSEISDPAEAIARLRVQGATLDPTTILQIARLSEQAMSARAAILAESESSPALIQVVAGLPRELNSLVSRVKNKILPSGELDDRASPELARLRHEVVRLRSSITRSLENLMRRSEEAVQDELVTIRNDRFVIPVKADHRGHIKGVAHGFSSSGATAFVEPLETIESNNELQGLREAEEREISKILFGLTEELRLQISAIEMAAAAVAELDFVNAKAVFHQRFNCVIPEISQAEASGVGASSGALSAERAGAELTFELIEARVIWAGSIRKYPCDYLQGAMLRRRPTREAVGAALGIVVIEILPNWSRCARSGRYVEPVVNRDRCGTGQNGNPHCYRHAFDAVGNLVRETVFTHVRIRHVH